MLADISLHMRKYTFPAKENAGIFSYQVLTMVNNTQNYRSFGLCPSSGILDARKHKVSETDQVRMGMAPTQLGPLESANLNHWTTPVSGRYCMSSLSQILLHIFLLSPVELAWSLVIKQL
jgi:hypothetical protein